MNFTAFERAQVAAFAYRQARHTGSLDCMRAVCFILRNRVRSAWGESGSWLSVIAQSHLTAAAFEPSDVELASANGGFKPDDRLLQMIVRDVDDIYLGQDRFDDRVRQVCCEDPKKLVLYYCFVERPPRPWFAENIIRNQKEHPHVGQIGAMMLYR
jgi:hypothetical protein